jgi:hypothetical protein
MVICCINFVLIGRTTSTRASKVPLQTSSQCLSYPPLDKCLDPFSEIDVKIGIGVTIVEDQQILVWVLVVQEYMLRNG